MEFVLKNQNKCFNASKNLKKSTDHMDVYWILAKFNNEIHWHERYPKNIELGCGGRELAREKIGATVARLAGTARRCRVAEMGAR